MQPGCRRGELLALTWADIDFVAVPSTKSKKPRVTSLPASAIEILREHRGSQPENRRLCGVDYRDDLNLVLCAPDGNYLKPDSVTAKVCLLASKAGLKGASLHTLRHSYGSSSYLRVCLCLR